MLLLVLVGCSGDRQGGERADQRGEYPIRAWPLYESARTEDGGHLLWATPFYHHKTGADGRTDRRHIFNYIAGRDFWAWLPLLWQAGPPEARHTGVLPFYVGGPGYDVIPPLLTVSTTEARSRNTWVTPLFHYDRRQDGGDAWHILNWIHDPSYDVVFPLGWNVDLGEYGRHWGLMPLWLQGPDYWSLPAALIWGTWRRDGSGWRTWITPFVKLDRPDAESLSVRMLFVPLWDHDRDGWSVPPLLTGSRWQADGATATWITPLVRFGQGADGRFRGHVLNVYRYGTDWGVLPLWSQGQDYWCAPPLLSGAWDNDLGGRSAWATPWYHRTTDDRGQTWWHALNYFRGPTYDVVAPFFYSAGPDGARSHGIPLVYHADPQSLCLPTLLSGSWARDNGGRTTWATPLFHRTTDRNDQAWWHCLNYFQGPGYRVLAPVWYDVGGDGRRYHGVPLLYHDGPGWWVSPPLMTGSWDNDFGGRSTWATPLFHHTTDGRDRSWWHLLNLFHGPSYDVFFPLAYRFGTPEARYWGILGGYHATPQAWFVPVLLSASWQNDAGGRSAWATPFFHHSTNGAGQSWWHLLNYFRGPDYDVVFPFFYRHGPDGARSHGVPLIYHAEADGRWCAPPLLSGHFPRGDGGWSTWLTPFFHRSTDPSGQSWWHLLNYFHGPDYDVVAPFFYRNGPAGARSHGVPLVYHAAPDSLCVPPLLSGAWKNNAGGQTTWLTPFFHRTTDGQDRSWWHLLNYFHGPEHDVLFPLFYSMGPAGQRSHGIPLVYGASPDSLCLPPLLSGTWKNGLGGRTTWLSPFFHRTTDGQDRSWWHLLNYFHGPEHDVLFPVAYRYGEEGRRSHGIVPFYHHDPEWTVVPPLFSASWKRDAGGTTTVATPLFHLSTDAQGDLDSLHLLNWYQDRRLGTLFPLYWHGAGGTTVVPPLYLGMPEKDGFSHSILWPLAEYRTGEALDLDWGTQLKPFVIQSAGKDYECNLLWRAFHLRHQGDTTICAVQPIIPLWRSEHHQDEPTDWRILGGLVGRYCDRQARRSRYHLFWFIPISGESAY